MKYNNDNTNNFPKKDGQKEVPGAKAPVMPEKKPMPTDRPANGGYNKPENKDTYHKPNNNFPKKENGQKDFPMTHDKHEMSEDCGCGAGDKCTHMNKNRK